MDPAVQQALLQDPSVQAAVRKAGKDALSDPAVQQMILQTCKEKFPELASAAKDKVLEWAHDPEVQRQAHYYAGRVTEVMGQAVSQVNILIEQGPAGVRVLAFFGGLASVANAVMFGALEPTKLMKNPVAYLLYLHLVVFALTTMLFEAKTEWIEQWSALNAYQSMLLEKAKFLSDVLGRGLFYGFQGTLWLLFANLGEILNYALGFYFLFLALLYVGMHFDIMPKDVVAKMRSAASVMSRNAEG